jgi:hypothetical protein
MSERKNMGHPSEVIQNGCLRYAGIWMWCGAFSAALGGELWKIAKKEEGEKMKGAC